MLRFCLGLATYLVIVANKTVFLRFDVTQGILQVSLLLEVWSRLQHLCLFCSRAIVTILNSIEDDKVFDIIVLVGRLLSTGWWAQ